MLSFVKLQAKIGGDFLDFIYIDIRQEIFLISKKTDKCLYIAKIIRQT
jgi:hypothetical protein